MSTNPLKLLGPKAGDFSRYSPALENVGRSESNLLPMNAIAIPSFLLHTAQMLGFKARSNRAENCSVLEGGRGKGAENKPSPFFRDLTGLILARGVPSD